MVAKKVTLSSNVTIIPGVGKTRENQLARLGIQTIRDLIYYFPRTYENRTDIRLLGECDTDNIHAYVLTVSNDVTSVMIRKGMTISKFKAFDKSGTCEIIFFNSPFIKDIFRPGASFRFYGKLSFSKTRRLTLTSPKYEAITNIYDLPSYVPIYSLTDGMTSKTLCKLIELALDEVLPTITDPLPEHVRVTCNLPTLTTALKNIHFPSNSDQISSSARRLAFDEMLYFALGISLTTCSKNTSVGVKFEKCDINPLLDMLKYDLTNDQKKCINDIYSDTVIKPSRGNPPPMSRIIIGDVGSGKTICAISAMYIAAKSGFQSALMVPTEILANQHGRDVTEIFSKLGLKTAILTSSTKQSERKNIELGIQNGNIDVIIGTHAILIDKLVFKNLGLIITDEQHRFGVSQRAKLKNKEKTAHMLVMSATPIPRTLALALYGDLDVSRITEMPKGRQSIDTFLISNEYRNRLYRFIESQLRDGGQCYIVCPAIDSGTEYYSLEYDEKNQENTGTAISKNVLEHTEEIRSRFSNYRVEFIHGKMKSTERDSIIKDFHDGKINILVTTTVIEVGINVPNANLMIIENAERYGLSQLHQIRGRVGRGTRKSYCILISDLKTDKSIQRLSVLKKTNDGFEIAEQDLMLRGPGEFFSKNSDYNLKQSGGIKFKMASIYNNEKLMSLSFEAAKKILNFDPNLEARENAMLKNEVSVFMFDSSTIS